MNEVNLREFDIMGVIRLSPEEVSGIEKYVTPVLDDDGIPMYYLSRSKEYYNIKSMDELQSMREQLKSKLKRFLNEDRIKKQSIYNRKNYVIVENMLNYSAKSYYAKFEAYCRNNNEETYNEMEQAKRCLLSDCKNLINFFEKSGNIVINSNNILPNGLENSAKRSIEMDNKAILYLFTKGLNLNIKGNKKAEILTPGYGSAYIGPFINVMYGYPYTNIFKSKYINQADTFSKKRTDINTLMSSPRLLNGKKTVLLIDDNVGTGKTMEEISTILKENGVKSVFTGAVQFNWKNYYKVAAGLKTGIDRFEIGDFDILSPFNYPGHKILKYSVDTLCSSGRSYEEYLESQSYNRNDVEESILVGMVWAHMANVGLTNIISREEVAYTANDDKTIEMLFGNEDAKDILKKEQIQGAYRKLQNQITKKKSQETLDNIIQCVINMDEITMKKDLEEKNHGGR